MSRHWDFHDFNDPDDDPVTRLRHLGGDYGPYDPANWDIDEGEDFEDDSDELEWDSDDSFLQTLCKDFEHGQKKYPRHPKDEVKRTPVGPMISLYDTRYFVPQWDEQMLGPAWRQKRAKWDFDNPPKPLPITDAKMKGAFKYCEECQLTWLVGHDGLSGHHHPLHLAWEMKEEHTDWDRYGMNMETSLIVHIRGDSAPEGQESNSSRGNTAGCGIFFGDGSKYNLAVRSEDKSIHCDAEGAEVEAIYKALTIATALISNVRRTLLTELRKSERAKVSKVESISNTRKGDGNTYDTKTTEDAEDDPLWEDTSDEDEDDALDKLDKVPFRLIVVSDNAKVIDNVCKYQQQWKEEKGKILTKQGKPVKNGDMYQPLCNRISKLEKDFDVTTLKLYLIPKEYNEGAAELARLAVDGNSISGATRSNP